MKNTTKAFLCGLVAAAIVIPAFICQQMREPKRKVLDQQTVENSQDKVIGEIRFGMSKTEFEDAWQKFYQSSQTTDSAGQPKHVFGNFEFADARHIVSEEGLIYFELIGKETDFRRLNRSVLDNSRIRHSRVGLGSRNIMEVDPEYLEQLGALKQVLEKKYGAGIKQQGLPVQKKTALGTDDLLYYWNIGSKEIQIWRIGRRSNCAIALRIFQPAKVDHYNKKQDGKADSATAKAADDI